MSETTYDCRVPASGTVHWLGTGLSTGSGLRFVADNAAETVVWGRTQAKAAAVVDRLALPDRARSRALVATDLEQSVRPGDVVVSMLPAPQHPDLVRMCARTGAHFACSSYVWPELPDAADAAAAQGLAVLTEAGLDPGIDHLMAHVLVDEARAAIGDAPATIRFTSFCGGIPMEPNPFRYRFSWAPRGVLHALREPARYVRDATVYEAPRPWEHTRPLTLAGEPFEVYPNRDSLPFTSQYHLPPGWRAEEFIRGTLRLDGWRDAWTEVFDELCRGDDASIDSLADELARRYPSGPADRDRVVLAVRLEVTADGRRWAGHQLLDVCGDATETAMARCVSLPLAVGVTELLADRLPTGLTRAAENGAAARRWLTQLAKLGLDCL